MASTEAAVTGASPHRSKLDLQKHDPRLKLTRHHRASSVLREEKLPDRYQSTAARLRYERVTGRQHGGELQVCHSITFPDAVDPGRFLPTGSTTKALDGIDQQHY